MINAITQLTLNNCRHFSNRTIEPCPGLNLITGPNASGKTTILEAIYVLAHGKSFRTSVLDRVIKHHQQVMTLFAIKTNTYDNIDIKLGLQKVKDGALKLHKNQEAIKSIKQFTEQLPVQLITTESTRFFTDGPKLRRDFLAWGLFYTNEEYYKYWRQYQRALAQRNRALKLKLPVNDLQLWDLQLVEAAEKLDMFYVAYLDIFKPVFDTILQQFLPDLDLDLVYDRGWCFEMPFERALKQSLDKSYALGYTTVGSHRLDVQLYIKEKEAQNVLSRGQLKMASYALSLAQGMVLKQITQEAPIYLIDDLSAELDQVRQRLVFETLSILNAQVFVTSIEPIGVGLEFPAIKSFPFT